MALADVRAGIGKDLGWHSLRRTLARLLQASGKVVKATQGARRHASIRLALELHTQSTMLDKQMAP